MRTLIVIAIAAMAVVGHTMIGSENAPPPTAEEALVHSPFHMMSDARDLQDMPFVAP